MLGDPGNGVSSLAMVYQGARLCACGRHTVSYWSTHGSDDSLAGYQATAATIEELTAACCDRQW